MFPKKRSVNELLIAKKGVHTELPRMGHLIFSGTQGVPKVSVAEKIEGEAFLLTVGAFLLTVKLLCLQSLKALI